jgi:hypothetical protein
MADKIEIQRDNLLLVEGTDAKLFFMYLLKFHNIQNIDVHDYHGIKDLTSYIRTLQKIDNYNIVKSILVVRDAETSAASAVQSVNSSLKATGIIADDIPPFKIINNPIKTGLMLFPGIDDANNLIESGTLEELCLKIFKEQNVITKTDAYIAKFQKDETEFVRPHKNKLHAALSFTDKYVGLKIGETAKAHGFDFDSPIIKPFLDIIKEVSEGKKDGK